MLIKALNGMKAISINQDGMNAWIFAGNEFPKYSVREASSWRRAPLQLQCTYLSWAGRRAERAVELSSDVAAKSGYGGAVQ